MPFAIIVKQIHVPSEITFKENKNLDNRLSVFQNVWNGKNLLLQRHKKDINKFN